MLVRGPFTISWGSNIIEDIEELDFAYAKASSDYTNVRGKTFEIDGATKVTVTLGLLSTDIPSLAILLPQYYVPFGGTLSSGETVTNEEGAIDDVPHKCDEAMLYNDFDIVSCTNPSQVTRMKNARSKVDTFDITNKLQKIFVKLVGEATGGVAPVQIINPQSTIGNFLKLDDSSYLLLDDVGDRMIL